MTEDLDVPAVSRCEFDPGFAPAMAVMCLEWPMTRPSWWVLPGGWVRLSLPPRRFGLRAQRLAEDEYAVCLVWDELAVSACRMTRRDLLDSSIGRLLGLLGTDLHYILAQPVEAGEVPRLAA